MHSARTALHATELAAPCDALCAGNGYPKLLRSSAPKLDPLSAPGGVEEAASHPDRTHVAVLKGARGLRLGMLPRDLFPPAFLYEPSSGAERKAALVGRVVRPNPDPARSHRLRLDRYDETDFEDMVSTLKSIGAWITEDPGSGESTKRSSAWSPASIFQSK